MQLLIVPKLEPVIVNISTVKKMNPSLECRRQFAGRTVENPSAVNLLALLILKGLHNAGKVWA